MTDPSGNNMSIPHSEIRIPQLHYVRLERFDEVQ